MPAPFHFVPAGLLVVNKPSGPTSRDVVNKVERLVRPLKVGHAGTLDPMAEGVLVVCIGRATRLVEYVQRFAKCYLGEFVLGCRSDTEDATGEITYCEDAPVPSRTRIEDACRLFLGETWQTPPAYSAKKIAGKRAYRMARTGENVELQPCRVTIDELIVREYQYPELTLHLVAHSGIYVRSLGRDLAQAVGTHAVMKALRRVWVGPFDMASAIAIDELSAERIRDSMISPVVALGDMERIVVTQEELGWIARGGLVTSNTNSVGLEAAAVSADGALAAVLSRPSANENWRPSINFLTLAY